MLDVDAVLNGSLQQVLALRSHDVPLGFFGAGEALGIFQDVFHGHNRRAVLMIGMIQMHDNPSLGLVDTKSQLSPEDILFGLKSGIRLLAPHNGSRSRPAFFPCPEPPLPSLSQSFHPPTASRRICVHWWPRSPRPSHRWASPTRS